jgi:hypothetical protein
MPDHSNAIQFLRKNGYTAAADQLQAATRATTTLAADTPTYHREGVRVIVTGQDDVIATFEEEHDADIYLKICNHWAEMIAALAIVMDGHSVAKLLDAAEAGVKAFEFLGERANAYDGAAGEAQANLDTVNEWAEAIRGAFTEEQLRNMTSGIPAMLELSADDDPVPV